LPERASREPERLHVPTSRLASLSPAVAEHVHRARRAEVFVRQGRHAAAERLLRDVAAALARRQAKEPGARVSIELGRLLLARGRAGDAQRVFADARMAAAESGSAPLALTASLWEVGALTDAARLEDAGARARSVESTPALDARFRAWTRACFVRLALWRADRADAEAHLPACETQDDPAVAAWIESMAVRALLLGGHVFEAGRRASEARRLPGLDTSPQARAVLARLELRVATAAGDFDTAALCLTAVRRHAREARMPLEVARATIVWIGALRRAGLERDAATLAHRLRRTAAVAPPLLRLAIDRAMVVASPPAKAETLRREPATAALTLVPELVGASAVLEELRRSIVRAAAAPFAVLVEGESGAGKELVARAIHRLGPRAARRFCDVNCAALPDDLVEAELFGHARGAYTGAPGDRAGLFEEANGGTLFLDEVSELSGRAQAKLLRVIQQQEVRRLGETATRPIDVRIVAAANRSMGEEVAAGRFRADLLYRLDVVRLRVPPLRERLDDVPALAAMFWRTVTERVGSSATLSDPVVRALTTYVWPGNVRELQNVMAALAVAAPSRGAVPPALLPARIREPQPAPATLAVLRAACERDAVRAALARAAGQRAEAARALGLTRQGLLKAMRRLDLG
jgi:DNA-binding NtrC family response regulator